MNPLCLMCGKECRKSYKKYCGQLCYYKSMENNNPRKFVKTSQRGIPKNFTTEQRKAMAVRIKININDKGLENHGGRCQWFTVQGVRAQGTYELYYLLKLVEQGLPLPQRGKPIRTPYGFYTPDFEYDDCFIEVKSSATLNKPLQIKKIIWVRQNIKRVIFKMYRLKTHIRPYFRTVNKELFR